MIAAFKWYEFAPCHQWLLYTAITGDKAQIPYFLYDYTLWFK